MGYAEELIDTRNRAVARRKEILATPKPSYSIDGQTIQWAAYLRALSATIASANEELHQIGFSDRISTGFT